MPFNKQAVSKKTLLENTQLLASLDGGKILMTLDNVNKLLGSKISIGAYTVTPKYYADASQSAEITDKTEIGKFILRVDNSKLVYDTKLATVDFRAAGVSGRRRQERRMRTQNRDQRRRESHDGNDRGAARPTSSPTRPARPSPSRRLPNRWHGAMRSSRTASPGRPPLRKSPITSSAKSLW